MKADKCWKSIKSMNIGSAISTSKLNGELVDTRFNFTLLSQNRETKVEIQAFAVYGSKPSYTNDYYSGWLGLAPFNANMDEKETNLMYGLKDKGFLSHNVVSFYYRTTGGSILKFGSYDESGLKDPNKFYVFKTIRNDSWSLNLTSVTIWNTKGS